MPHCLAGTKKHLFALGAHGAVWLPGCRFDAGNIGPPLGLGKDQGMEVFQKHEDAFPLYRLPGAYGCLVFNAQYPTESSTQGMGISPPPRRNFCAQSKHCVFARVMRR